MNQADLLLTMGTILLVVGGLFIFSGKPGNAEGNIQTIAPADAQAKLAEDKTVILVDVRTPEEYRETHIPGSINIPVDALEAQAAAILPDKNIPVMFYCRTGARSHRAAVILTKLDYRQVYDLGAIVNWPYETVTGDQP